MNVATISPKQLHELVEAGAAVELIDVRTPVEFRELRVTFARNVPLDRLDAAQLAAQRNGSEQPLYVICRSGNRSMQACQKFLAANYTNIVNVEGGALAWDKAGLQVVRGKQTIPLERQVPIATGSLVVAGTTLGALVDPVWFGLAAAVGAGQMFAGLTGNCLMANMLAKAPWNQELRR
ncbi:MAG TPA: rhodanese-like domain-containing protein [Pirellulales bacterium]|nr:rhodanese-like domain-containing protein [Pirellulales bacterium]